MWYSATMTEMRCCAVVKKTDQNDSKRLKTEQKWRKAKRKATLHKASRSGRQHTSDATNHRLLNKTRHLSGPIDAQYFRPMRSRQHDFLLSLADARQVIALSRSLADSHCYR